MLMKTPTPSSKQRDLAAFRRLAQMVDEAKTPEELVELDAKLGAAEQYMRESGLFTSDERRPVNEAWMTARWKLGRALEKVERGKPGPKVASAGLTQSFRAFLAELQLDRQTALEAQRIGKLPPPELRKIFSFYHKNDDFVTFTDLIVKARPYWYQASRKTKHQIIAATAERESPIETTYPLIYADPPWKFEIYSEKGLERTPDQHYETLTDEEIANFKVDGRTIPELAHEDAALFLWCTSSNIERALDIMDAWEFTYSTQAVWVKMNDGKLQTGLGLVFRNAHEVLLYGKRGKMPGPQCQPPSVFIAPRGKHSEKPAVVREVIEQMYPDFDEKTRAELFARGRFQGWACFGYEAKSHN
jgi:N6-adenosine-specific RNA methylase IME4